MTSSLIHILLVDDDQDSANYVRQLLALDGRYPFVVDNAPDPLAALKRLAQGPVDVILLDVHLQTAEALASLAHMRTAAPAVPVIGLLRRPDDARRAEALKLGAQACVIKTWVQASELADLLRYAAARRDPARLEEYVQELRASESRLRDLILRHPDAIVAVDEAGTVQFANPAAERLFGRTQSQLFGQEIGFPVILGNTSLLDVVAPDGASRLAEMRVVELTWEGAPGFLLALRDVSARRPIPATPDSETLYRAVLEAMPQAVAILNQHGVIQFHNTAWERLAAVHHTALQSGKLGDNYVALCQQAAEAPAQQAALELLTLLCGDKSHIQFDYNLPAGQWFTLNASVLTSLNHMAVVVTHTDITLFKQAEDARHASAQAQQHQRDLQQAAQEPSLPVAERAFGLPPLRENYPDVFAGHVLAYGVMLSQAIEHQVFDTRQQHSRELQAMAEQLGRYHARPRDIIDLHLAALRQQVQTATALKLQAYTEEGRWMALELMGHLASFYRQAWLTRTPAPPRSPGSAG